MTTQRRDDPELPHGQKGAPAKPSRTTEEVFPRDGSADDPASRQAGEDDAVRGDRMPKGADEPGAGL